MGSGFKVFFVMSDFDKFSLKCNYSWTDADKAKRHEHSIDDVIDTNNGYQVLDFINRFMEVSGHRSLESFNRVEKMVKRELPENHATRKEIESWLSKNLYKRV